MWGHGDEFPHSGNQKCTGTAVECPEWGENGTVGRMTGMGQTPWTGEKDPILQGLLAMGSITKL